VSFGGVGGVQLFYHRVVDAVGLEAAENEDCESDDEGKITTELLKHLVEGEADVAVALYLGILGKLQREWRVEGFIL